MLANFFVLGSIDYKLTIFHKDFQERLKVQEFCFTTVQTSQPWTFFFQKRIKSVQQVYCCIIPGSPYSSNLGLVDSSRRHTYLAKFNDHVHFLLCLHASLVTKPISLCLFLGSYTLKAKYKAICTKVLLQIGSCSRQAAVPFCKSLFMGNLCIV